MKPQKPRLHSVLVVEWIDSMNRTGWKYDDEVLSGTCPLIRTVGFVVNSTTQHVAIAHTLDTDGQSATGIILIPWGAVQRTLKVPPPKTL